MRAKSKKKPQGNKPKSVNYILHRNLSLEQQEAIEGLKLLFNEKRSSMAALKAVMAFEDVHTERDNLRTELRELHNKWANLTFFIKEYQNAKADLEKITGKL